MKSELSVVAVNDESDKAVGVITCFDHGMWGTLSFWKLFTSMRKIPNSMKPLLTICDEVKSGLPKVLKENGFTMA